ncbi:MAG: ABC transporter [Methylophaga sp.]|nr:MAG: ABC transporter [Methylophaga sp.]
MNETAKYALSVDAISINYEHKKVLNQLSLNVSDNEILCLLGQSGSGKTTVLKAIAGLLPLQQGSISVGGQRLSSVKTIVPPDKRGIGIIFQDYALFPHLSVLDNICFGIKETKQQAEFAAKALLELVKMEGYGSAFPHELSGGQQQRVAIARALAIKPKVLLLDEPFSNVDHHLRQQLMADIRQILKQRSVAAIFVTHNKAEAFVFADKLAFMEAGKVVQTGTAQSLYLQPCSAALAESMGEGNWLNVVVVDQYRTLSNDLGEITSTEPHGIDVGQNVRQFIRPNQLSFAIDGSGQGKMIDQVFNGDHHICTIVVGQMILIINQPLSQKISVGAQVSITVLAHTAMLFDG